MNCSSYSMVCKNLFCSKFPDTLEKSQPGKKTNSKAIAKRYALQANEKRSRWRLRRFRSKPTNHKKEIKITRPFDFC